MASKEEDKDFFEELSRYIKTSWIPQLNQISREHFVAAREHFKGHESLYKKIEQGDGVPCDTCSISVTADNYGEVLIYKSKLKVRCRHCAVPGLSFGI